MPNTIQPYPTWPAAAPGFRNPFPGSQTSAIGRRFGRVPLFAAIILLHVLIICALRHAHVKQVALTTLPTEVFITLLAGEAHPVAAQAPAPNTPKTVSVVAAAKPAPAPVPISTYVPVSNQAVPETTEAAAAPATPVAPTAPAAQVAALPVQPKLITSGVEYVRAPEPVYPVVSRRMHEAGKALVLVLVNEKGWPEKVEIKQSSGSAKLDQAALQAVMGALFKPFMDNGKPLAVYAQVPIRFQLDS